MSILPGDETRKEGYNKKAGHVGLLFPFRVLTAENPRHAPGISSSEGMLLLHHFLLFCQLFHKSVTLATIRRSHSVTVIPRGERIDVLI
jgi:hypothetical protein